ncbi:hypothetical protein GCM10025864_29600 [Luteimicrobium album]|uniref:DUF899 domain-containing protein n=1 Tax=Luteimicrobium album TaxID=1054550 RepID=A0ABQ6I4K5_9MICO|nr:DUF899 family protein [Luteimicrobium album]GMA25201.1 hypothetical protein GCM10025864_29600 [Luteimicrobium album]
MQEKAHTHAGDALAAARRRMPMTELPDVVVEGDEGPTPLLDLFGDHDQLILYKHMWHGGQPMEAQCEGCTLTVWDATYLDSRGIAFAVLFEGPWAEARELRDLMGYPVPCYSVHDVDDPVLGTGFGEFLFLLRHGGKPYLTYAVTGRGTEAMMSSVQLIDRTVHGRGERWEDSPPAGPRTTARAGGGARTGGRRRSGAGPA